MEEKVIEALSNKNFALDRRPILDKIYLMEGADTSNGELETAVRYGGFAYQTQDGFIGEATREAPIYRYGKKYTKFKLTVNIFTHSLDPDPKAVEKTLDTVASKLKRADILETTKGFYGIDVYHEQK